MSQVVDDTQRPGFRLVLKSMTLNDLERRNGRYALCHFMQRGITFEATSRTFWDRNVAQGVVFGNGLWEKTNAISASAELLVKYTILQKY